MPDDARPRSASAVRRGAARAPPGRDDRRHRPDAARRHAAGARARCSTTRSRASREAMRAEGRRSTPFASLSARRSSACGAARLIVQPARQPGGAIESLEAVRARPARTRSRRWPAHSITPGSAARRRTSADVRDDREVPRLPLSLPLFFGAAALFALPMARHLRVFAAAQPIGAVTDSAETPQRAGRRRSSTPSSRSGCSATRRSRCMHHAIFWGFVILTIGTANLRHGRARRRPSCRGRSTAAIWAFLVALQNVIAAGDAARASRTRSWRRLVARPARLTLHARRADDPAA